MRREHEARRSALLRLAIISSAASKVFGLGLQAIAIPLLYHSLGEHRYELYLLLTAALASIALVQMGAGPGLTQAIAKAYAEGRRDQEAALLRAAFRLAVATAVIGAAVILMVVHTIPPERIFGAAFGRDRAAILAAAHVCALVLMAQIVSGVVDSAFAGYQEQVYTNLAAMVANILTLGLLFYVCYRTPTLNGVILVLYGLPPLCRVATLVVLCLRRPYLLEGLLRSCRGFYPVLLNVGLAFWSIQLGGILEQHTGTYVLAHFASARATDLFAVTYRSLSLAGAVVAIVTQPLWPAFTDAIAHRDFNWIRRAYLRIRRALTIYSCLVAIVTAVGGRWIFQNLLHIDVGDEHLLFWLLGVYFVANIWTHLFYVTLMGMNSIWKVAMVALGENLLMLLIGLGLVPRLGASGMALAYLAASVVLPVWLLPRLMERALENVSSVPAMVQEPQRLTSGPDGFKA